MDEYLKSVINSIASKYEHSHMLVDKSSYKLLTAPEVRYSEMHLKTPHMKIDNEEHVYVVKTDGSVEEITDRLIGEVAREESEPILIIVHKPYKVLDSIPNILYVIRCILEKVTKHGKEDTLLRIKYYEKEGKNEKN